jgi:hypothetical protein
MKNTQDKEINEFLKAFEEGSSNPSDAFRKKLEKNVIKEYNGKARFYLYLKVLLPVFLIVFIFGVSMNGLSLGTRNTPQQYSVSDQRKKEIITKLAKTNVLPKIEKSIATNNIAAMSDISFAESKEKDLIKENDVELISYPLSFPSEPVLGVSETVKMGSKFSSCESLTSRYEGVSEIKSYYFTDNSKGVVKVEEKIMKNESVLGESFPFSYPDSYPVSYAIENGVDILSEEVEGENKYFVLKIEQDVQGCEQEIIFTIKIEESSLEFKEVSAYSDEVLETNLIYKSEFNEIKF